MTNKNKRFTAWRMIGIVVTTLLILAGFAGAYWMGVQRGALTDGDGAWMNPVERYEEDGTFRDGYAMPHMYGGGYYGRGYVTPFFFLGRILGFFFFLMVISAFLRLVFFPFRLHRYHHWGMGRRGCYGPRHHMHHGPRGFHHPGHGHGYGPWGYGYGKGEWNGKDQPKPDEAEDAPAEE